MPLLHLHYDALDGDWSLFGRISSLVNLPSLFLSNNSSTATAPSISDSDISPSASLSSEAVNGKLPTKTLPSRLCPRLLPPSLVSNPTLRLGTSISSTQELF